MVITFDNYIYITSVPKKNVPSAVVLLSTALGTFFCGTDVTTLNLVLYETVL